MKTWSLFFGFERQCAPVCQTLKELQLEAAAVESETLILGSMYQLYMVYEGDQ